MDVASSNALAAIERSISELMQFISQYSALSNAHNTDFFCKDLWEHLVPEAMRRELSSLTDTELVKLTSCDRTSVASSTAPPGETSSLHEFLDKAHSLSLCEHGFITQFYTNVQTLHTERKKPFVGNFMSSKKGHEVEIMSDICRCVAEKECINQVSVL